MLLLLISSSNCFAQDPQFSQFYANSLYLNPALTGNTAQFRFASTYRNQWPSLPKGYVSYTTAFDYNVEKLKSGIGLIATHDKAGRGGLKFTNIAALYSTYVRLNRLTYIKGGLKFSYTTRGVNQSELVFSDQIIRDGAPFSIESLDNNINHLDLGGGLILSNSEKYWFGFSIDHINQPTYGFLSTDEALPIKTSLHGGWNFEIENPRKVVGPKEFKAMFNYKMQGQWDQFDLGGYYANDPIYLGMWYRGIPIFKRYDKEFPNNESIILLLGVKSGDLRIGYSYDITISKLAGNSGGAHEISLIYEISNPKKKRKNRRYFLAPCPKF